MNGLIVLVAIVLVVLLGVVAFWRLHRPVLKRRDVDVFDALDRARRNADPTDD